jgi:hypothetical protein
MTYVPQKLADLQNYMQARTGLPANALGVYPDDSHDGGYHCGWDRRRTDSSGNVDDYSWDESSRDWNHKTNAARAFDCGMYPRLREMSAWIVSECQRGALDTQDIREVIYSPDGKVVVRWDRLGVRSSGDSSHLTHTHFSWFADAEDRDKVSVFQRFFEGGGMDPQGEHNMGYVIQNGLFGLDWPNATIPAQGSLQGGSWPSRFAAVMKALMEGTDAVLPAFVHMPETTWKNGTAARFKAVESTLARLESKIDQLLAVPPGTMNPDSIRTAVRAELDATKLGPQG